MRFETSLLRIGSRVKVSSRAVWALCVAFVMPAKSADSAVDPVPKVPLTLWDLQVTSSSETQLKESSQALGKQSISTQQTTFLQRFPAGFPGWYFGAGVQGESFSFGGSNAAGIKDMHDVAGVLSLEYFVEGVQAASLSLKPGLYFTNRVHSDCFDAPVQLVGGIPLTDRLNGVVGGSGARFYHHVIPIVGLSWTMNSKWRLDAVFPEPALVCTLGKGTELKFGGELQSGGFRTDSGAPVEYYSYQLKGRFSYALGGAVTLSGALGYELERSFDYFRNGPHFKSEGAVLLQIGAGISF